MDKQQTIGERKYLLVGLGGSGGKVITKLYERLIRERGENFRSNVVCVAIDTDQDELNELAQLGVKKVQISGSGTVGQMVNALGDDVHEWCPATQNEGSFYSSHVFNGASQCRLKSRLCFASFLKNKNNTLNGVLEEFLHITSDTGNSSMNQPPLVYIVSSIAGGTGSGIFIQTAFYIKKFFQGTGLQPMVYGLFACPDLYKNVVPPQQVPNLYANAYAVIRELNAFNMICGDDMDAPWGGKISLDLEISTECEGKLFQKNAKGRYGDKPYDILYFIDRVNSLSKILGGLDKYYEAMGDIAYSHLYSEISGEVLSGESNEMHAHSTAPCAIYGSAGAGTLKYPYEDIMRYFADRSIRDSFDSVWKELDAQWRSFVRTKDADARQHGLAKYIPGPNERGDEFCKYFEKATDSSKMQPGKLSFMGSMVKRGEMDAVACLFQKIEAIAKKIISDDKRFADRREELKLNDLLAAKEEIMQALQESGEDPFFAIEQMDDKLDDYCADGLRYVFDDSVELANKIFCVDPAIRDIYESESECGLVNILLRNFENNDEWVHPVAARYMLYRFRSELKTKMSRLLSKNEDTAEDDLVDFRNKLVNGIVVPHLGKLSVSDEEGSQTANAEVLKTLFNRWFGMKATKTGLEAYFASLEDTMTSLKNGFRNALMFFAFSRVLERVEALINEYEVFFDNIDEFIKNADAATKRGEIMHEKSSTAIYVCADADTKRGMYEDAGRNINLQTGETASTIAASLFENMRNRIQAPGAKRNHKEDIRNAAGFFDAVSDTVVEQSKNNLDLQSSIQMNAVEAILREYALKNPDRADDVQNYSDNEGARNRVDSFIANKLNALSVMAAPLLQFNVRDPYYAMFRKAGSDGQVLEKPEVTNTYRYLAHSRDCGESIRELVGTTGGDAVQAFYSRHSTTMPGDSENQSINTSYVESEVTDPYSILCYSTVHCLQPYQIHAFDEVNNGAYYENYSRRLVEMRGLQKYSMTPHMDKRWHKHGVMPYINVAKEKDRRLDLAKAFLYALCYGKIGFVTKGSDSKLIFNDVKLGRQGETIYYKGNIIPKNKINRVMYWFAEQEELIERYSALLDNAIDAELMKLSKYDGTQEQYKRSITEYADILNQMRRNIFRNLDEKKDSEKPAKKTAKKSAKKAELAVDTEAAAKVLNNIISFAWNLHMAEENELDKNYAELLVECLCEIIKKYASAPYNKEAIENRDLTTVAYKNYLEVAKHVANTFVDDYGMVLCAERNIEKESEADKKERLSKGSFGRSTGDLSDEGDGLETISNPIERALSKEPSYAWVKEIFAAAFAE